MMDSVPVSASGSKTGLQPQQGVPYDLESAFEPQTRARSHTWPLPRSEEYIEGNVVPNVSASKEGVEGVESGTPPQHGSLGQGAGLLPVKKNSSRRNAWGNHSYADLITQAITSAPDKRLTLSQIYEWMMQNITYFREKGESNSSAGWKNSIRHNLSLHSRFMRVQNEGTGKSSWWMINNDAKPGKSSRRRAMTMEPSKSDKRRGRVRKKLEAIRDGGLQNDAIPSPSNSVSEGLDLFPDSPLQPGSGFQLSPDFRPRASSNDSSCGRLSPISAIPGKPEWTPTYTPYSPEQLAGSLAETMKLDSYQMYQTSPPSHQTQTGPPPSYYETQYQRSNSLTMGSSSFALQPTPQSANQQRCPIHGLQPCACQMNLSPVAGMSPSYQQSEPSPTALGNSQQQTLQYMIQTQQCQQQQQQLQQHQQPQTGATGTSQTQTPTPCGPAPSTMMGQLMGALNNSTILDDLNINIEDHGGFACTVEEVIKHELSMDGTLDFNFQQSVMGTAAIQVSDRNIGQNGAVSQNNVVGTTAGNAPAGVYVSTNAATPAAPPSWVH
ncbi:forkhead box protein O [Hylaeus volcanicus]|uniref:forkhead box protein O n=1 Tax=Hylaeus volcanicus TaxID=313075 RepID=UPI0023B7A305|nr:forkhead box protein O [Hylaeus volcanicus]